MDNEDASKKLIEEHFARIERTLSLIAHEPEAQEIMDAAKRHIMNNFQSPQVSADEEGGKQ